MLTIKNLVDGTLVPSVSLLIFLTVGSLLLLVVYNRHAYGLQRYDGPFLASLTNLWRVRDSYVNGRKRPTIVQLHQKYGDVVRTGPNTLSFASPNAIADIYGPASRMPKVRISSTKDGFITDDRSSPAGMSRSRRTVKGLPRQTSSRPATFIGMLDTVG